MSDQEIKIECIKVATRTALPLATPEQIMGIADKYYRYVNSLSQIPKK